MVARYEYRTMTAQVDAYDGCALDLMDTAGPASLDELTLPTAKAGGFCR